MPTTESRDLTQADLLALLTERFGDDPAVWSFQCPQCGDVASIGDFDAALAESPRERKGADGKPQQIAGADIVGQECIGRTLGALQASDNTAWTASGGRGCDWTAYGLLGGPWTVTTSEGHTFHCFPVAPAPVAASVS